MTLPAFTPPCTVSRSMFAPSSSQALTIRRPPALSRTRVYPRMVSTPLDSEEPTPEPTTEPAPEAVIEELMDASENDSGTDGGIVEIGMESEQGNTEMTSNVDMTVTEEDENDFEIIEELENVEPCAAPQFVINEQMIAEAREKFRLHATDTGSPEYQIATLTIRITYLTEHLKRNPKDFSSTRGLLKMVSTRRRLLKYVKGQDPKRFNAIIDGLKIRVSQKLREL